MPVVLSQADLEALRDEELASRSEALLKRELTPEVWCEMAGYASEAARRRPGAKIDTAAAVAQGYCAEGQARHVEAIAHWTKAEGLYGSNVPPDLRIELEQSILLAAVRSNDKAAFAAHLRHVAERGWADEFRQANFPLWRYGLGLIGSEQAGPIALLFARSPAFANLPEDLRPIIGWHAIKPAIAAGEIELASRMALQVPDPTAVRDMLIDRDFAPIWPRLAEAAGPRLKLLRDAAVLDAKQRVADNPKDGERSAALVDALSNNGDHAGAVAVAALVDHSQGASETYREDDGWIINAEVKALDALGRQGEADTLFDRLGQLSPANGRGWVVSFTINRAHRLVEQGRWAEALPAAELAVKVAAEHGNAYAKRIAAADRYCAALKLNPANPALAGWWREITTKPNDAIGSSIQAALCKGDRRAAEQMLRQGLDDPASRRSALKLLQPSGFDFVMQPRSVLEDPRTLLADNPALRRAFEKYGRELPEPLRPN